MIPSRKQVKQKSNDIIIQELSEALKKEIGTSIRKNMNRSS
jgi:flagellin-specific chaperone FliS